MQHPRGRRVQGGICVCKEGLGKGANYGVAGAKVGVVRTVHHIRLQDRSHEKGIEHKA